MKCKSGLQREIEFERKLRGLLGEYSYSLHNIIAILYLNAASSQAQVGISVPAKGTRRARQAKHRQSIRHA